MEICASFGYFAQLMFNVPDQSPTASYTPVMWLLSYLYSHENLLSFLMALLLVNVAKIMKLQSLFSHGVCYVCNTVIRCTVMEAIRKGKLLHAQHL